MIAQFIGILIEIAIIIMTGLIVKEDTSSHLHVYVRKNSAELDKLSDKQQNQAKQITKHIIDKHLKHFRHLKHFDEISMIVIGLLAILLIVCYCQLIPNIISLGLDAFLLLVLGHNFDKKQRKV